MNLLQRPAKEKLYTRGLWHGKKGEHLIDGQDIIDARGPIEGEDLKPLAIDDVPFGLISNAELTELIESAAALHKPLVEGEDQRNQLLARLLTYRLVIDQQESGLWGEERMRPFGLTSGSFAVNHQNQQKSMFNRAKKDMQNKGKVDAKRYSVDLSVWRKRVGISDANKLPEHLYKTGSALYYLLNGLVESVPLTDAEVDGAIATITALQNPPSEEGEGEGEGDVVGADEAGEAADENQSDEKADIPLNLPKSNEAVWELWSKMMEKMGKELSVPVKTEAPQTADAPKDDPPADSPKETVPNADDIMDDILGE